MTTPPSDDASLVARVRQRDAGAFATLYDRYARVVFRMAASLVGPDEAEEVVQDVFLQLWNRADQYEPARGTFAVWFMTVARHHTSDHLRERSAQEQVESLESLDHLLGNTPDDSIDLDEGAWLKASGQNMRRVFGELPEAQRRVLLLAYFGGLSHREIAERLQLPLGTVKKRIRLGLQKLRAALVEQHTPQPHMRTVPTDEDTSI